MRRVLHSSRLMPTGVRADIDTCHAGVQDGLQTPGALIGVPDDAETVDKRLRRRRRGDSRLP
jgi:hypothetical protein